MCFGASFIAHTHTHTAPPPENGGLFSSVGGAPGLRTAGARHASTAPCGVRG
jgi:hypothetical protein